MTLTWLHLHLEAPMMSFGSVRIDQINPTDRLPRQSQITGLVGNALGLRWPDSRALQDLQDRLIYGAVALRPGDIMVDDQNAQIEKYDPMWTTFGPSGRDGASYGGAHQRRRSYLTDAAIAVVLRSGAGDDDTLAIASALETPARPLFIGRKSCLPSRPIYAGTINAESARAALMQIPGVREDAKAALPLDEGLPGNETVQDLRDWTNDIHAGERSRRTERLVA